MPDAMEKAAAFYADNNAVRVLAEVASIATGGIYGAIDAGLVAIVSDFRESRVVAFFDEIASGELEITDDLIRSNDFLHAYFSTLNAAQRARTAQRAQLYARLLKGAVRSSELGDAYAEHLDVLNSLSDRELCCLMKLQDLERSRAADLDAGIIASEGAAASSYWGEFKDLVADECGVAAEELSPFLTRLMRTGAYQALNVWGGDLSQPGVTTSVFTTVARLLEVGAG